MGFMGVSFFFVLSGFVLVYTYAGRPLNLPKFLRARFARIYPAYAFSLIVTAPFFFEAVKIKAASLALVSTLVVTLLQAWFPQAALAWNKVAWSLSTEAFFYLVFPFALFYFERRKRSHLLPFIAAVLASRHRALLLVSLGHARWNGSRLDK